MIAAAYLRKSNDEGSKATDMKSVQLQRDEIEAFARERGWTLDERYVYTDDGISGATWGKARAGLRALLDALEPNPPFQVVLVTEPSRIGRDAIRTLGVVQTLEEAGVAVWSTSKRKQIEHKDIGAIVESWSDESERTRVIERVNRARKARFEAGLVTGGRVFGYSNVAVPGIEKAVRRVVNPTQAAVVVRIFEMTAKGYGLTRIARQLTAENVPAPERLGPKGIAKREREGVPMLTPAWSASGVREILTRETYKGVLVEGRVKRGKGRGGRPVRIRVPEAEWKRRPDESLRIVSDDQWNAAHAQTAATSAKYLRQGNLLAGKAESLNGRYLLSAGLAVCGATKADGTICASTLHAARRGRNLTLSYVCQAHRERGASACPNGTGVPAHELHAAVISSLRQTFNAETFEAHLKKSAEDEQARASRAAERATIIERLPILASQEERLAEAVATGDGSVGALVAALKARQHEREGLEARLAELETWERDAKADEERVEQLRERWGSWQGALDGDPVLARQLLKKVMDAPIYVRPTGRRMWSYVGVGRYDRLLSGALVPGEVVSVHSPYRTKADVLEAFLKGLGINVESEPAPLPAPIAGGSDDADPATLAECKTQGVNSGPPI